MAAGKISIQANDGKVAGVVFEDGASSNVTVTIPKEGGKVVVADSNGNVGVGGVPASGFKQEIFGSSIASPASTSSRLSLRELGNVSALNFVSANEGGTLVERIWSSTALSLGSNATERVRIDTTGNVLITSGTGALGYGTGSGGTVTQLTSKSTAVTLNKPCGLITMHNSTLAAGATVQFLLYNTLAGIGSNMIANPQGTDNYSVEVRSVFNNGCSINVTNKTGGSLSEAVQIQFALIKGALA